jgi:hypothetical protein
MAKPNALEDAERATDEEARKALKQFFGALSPSERRRMWRLFVEMAVGKSRTAGER